MLLQKVVKLVAGVVVLAVILYPRVAGDERILGAYIQRIVHLPVDIAHLPRRMIQALQGVVEQLDRTEAHAHALNGGHERLDDVRRDLEYIRPDVVEQVSERVLAAEAVHAERHVTDGGHGRLTMHQIAVHERVLEQWRHRVDIVLAHLANVLEHERE